MTPDLARTYRNSIRAYDYCESKIRELNEFISDAEHRGVSVRVDQDRPVGFVTTTMLDGDRRLFTDANIEVAKKLIEKYKKEMENL